MVKTNQVKLTITNNSGITMIYDHDWFDHGRLADGFTWDKEIADKYKDVILMYERDWSTIGKIHQLF